MRIAIPTNDGATISAHFGRSAAVLVFEIEDGRIKGREVRANAPHHSHEPGACGHEAGDSGSHNHDGILAALSDCDVVICAGMGGRAADALKAAGIAEIATTTPGPAEEAVAAFLAGALPATDQGFCRCAH
jgi:predicted Fe-Mo cluster-binding NifX family protein